MHARNQMSIDHGALILRPVELTTQSTRWPTILGFGPKALGYSLTGSLTLSHIQNQSTNVGGVTAERCHEAAGGNSKSREGQAELERSILALTSHVSRVAPVDTQEQRVTNLIQSLLCGACLGETPLFPLPPPPCRGSSPTPTPLSSSARCISC